MSPDLYTAGVPPRAGGGPGGPGQLSGLQKPTPTEMLGMDYVGTAGRRRAHALESAGGGPRALAGGGFPAFESGDHRATARRPGLTATATAAARCGDRCGVRCTAPR